MNLSVLIKKYTFSKDIEVIKEDEILEKSSSHERKLLKVNRDNVFDYVIAAVNQTDGGDASVIKFQQPEFSAQDDGLWRIAANNKSGHGSYTFIVDQDGTVQIWDGMMNEKIEEQKVTLN